MKNGIYKKENVYYTCNKDEILSISDTQKGNFNVKKKITNDKLY